MLSGGSTMFKDFGRRLQRDVNKLITNRINLSEQLSGGKFKAKPMDVQVKRHLKNISHRIFFNFKNA